jgi:hypothetical protein
MARMLHRQGKPATGQKVFIAVAAYDGNCAGFTFALFHTGVALTEAGIGHELAIYSGNCHVDDSRNRLVRDFLNSDCTDLVFLDTDLNWYARNFVELLGYDRDVVAGVYPKKHGDDTYPVMLLPGEIWADRDGLIEVAGVPTGFLRIRRNVLERMAAVAEKFNVHGEASMAIPCVFERQVHGGQRWGGDYMFCKKWREMGGKLYVAPKMRFEHSGEHTWAGSVGAWLKQRACLGLSEPLQAFAEGREEPQDVFDLFDAWGNPYAADPSLLIGLAMAARTIKGPILELGCGLSTLVLAACAPNSEIHFLEDNPAFAMQVQVAAERVGLTNIRPHVHAIKDDWYDTTTLPKVDWAMVFIDGPRRTIGGRTEAFQRLDLSKTPVIIDDVQDEGGLPAMKRLLQQTHRVEVIGTPRRQFAIGAPKPQMAMAAE